MDIESLNWIEINLPYSIETETQYIISLLPYEISDASKKKLNIFYSIFSHLLNIRDNILIKHEYDFSRMKIYTEDYNLYLKCTEKLNKIVNDRQAIRNNDDLALSIRDINHIIAVSNNDILAKLCFLYSEYNSPGYLIEYKNHSDIKKFALIGSNITDIVERSTHGNIFVIRAAKVIDENILNILE
ncbi:MAG: hypothetical protein LC122_12405 [Chitinophagales bacterium]|nr:hypothetical protein [Chitinophagales bacterium]